MARKISFSAFWRSVNAELAKRGHKPAKQGDAAMVYEFHDNPRDGADIIIDTREKHAAEMAQFLKEELAAEEEEDE